MSNFLNAAATFIATLGFGKRVPAPGTFGSIAALIPLLFLPKWFFDWELLSLITVAIIVGFYAIRVYLTINNITKDPQEVIFDEVIGQWVAALGTGGDPVWLLISFVIFRILDITKPGLIGTIDRMHNPTPSIHTITVIADDFLAGGITAALIFIVRFFVDF